MDLMDIYNRYIGLFIAAVFWIIVIIQFILRLREKKEIKRTKTCPNCGQNDLHVDIYSTVSSKNKIKDETKIKEVDKVNLVKNIGGGFIALMLAVLLLYQFYRLADDWITTGGKATGIIKDTLKVKLAFTGSMLIFGIIFAILGILLIWAYIQKKEKHIILDCNVCKSVFTIDGVILKQGVALDSLVGGQKGEISSRPITESLDVSEQSELATENMESCAKCGRQIETSDLTCSHCGHTQWGVIGAMAGVSLLLIGFVVYRILNANSSGLIFWGGLVLGILLSAVTISFVNEALRKSSD